MIQMGLCHLDFLQIVCVLTSVNFHDWAMHCDHHMKGDLLGLINKTATQEKPLRLVLLKRHVRNIIGPQVSLFGLEKHNEIGGVSTACLAVKKASICVQLSASPSVSCACGRLLQRSHCHISGSGGIPGVDPGVDLGVDQGGSGSEQAERIQG